MIKNRQMGFTLIEISIALLMIGILAASGTHMLSAKYKQSKAHETLDSVYEAKQGLLRFLKVNKFLPCPDTDGDGYENTKTNKGHTVCKNRKGMLPYLDLAVKGQDAWGHPFYYRVNDRAEKGDRVTRTCESASVFGRDGGSDNDKLLVCSLTNAYYCQVSDNISQPADKRQVCISESNMSAVTTLLTTPPYLSLATLPVASESATQKNLTIKDAISGNTVDELVVGLVVSFGKNGFQTWASMAGNTNCSGTLEGVLSAEMENCDGDKDFNVGIAQTLDDYLEWITLREAKVAIIESGGFK